jgi:hypothetical protein
MVNGLEEDDHSKLLRRKDAPGNLDTFSLGFRGVRPKVMLMCLVNERNQLW